MSFPKAKIHRFNEETSCAPPPGRYDPKLDSKIKGAVLTTSKRFPEQMCSSSSLDNLEKASSSQVTFRTPQLTRKVISLTPRVKYLKEKNFDTPGSDSSANSGKSCDRLTLACKQKKEVSRADYQRLENEISLLADNYAHELWTKNLEITKLKEELKEIKVHEDELKLILEEKAEIARERSKEILEIKLNLNTLEDRLNTQRHTYQTVIDESQNKILQLQTERDDLEGLIAENQLAMLSLNEKYIDVTNKLEDACRERDDYLKVIDEVIEKSSQNLEEVKKRLEIKIESLEREFDDAQEKLPILFQTSLNIVSDKYGLKAQQVEHQCKMYFDSIEELRKVMINKIEKSTKDIVEADERCKFLYKELCTVQQERDDLLSSDLEKKLIIIEAEEMSETLQKELDQCKDKCKRFEVTQNTMKNTISALSNRLLESENEVERLNKVEIDLESQKRILEEKSRLLLSSITNLRNGMDKMEKEIIEDVRAMKVQLEAKVEFFKTEALKQEEVFRREAKNKEETIQRLLAENDYFKTEVGVKTDHVRILEENYKQEIITLEYDSKILKEEIVSLKNDNSILKENILVLDSDNIKFKKEIEILENDSMKLKDNYEIEIASLQHENINKAQNIVDLTMSIDTLKETIAQFETEITCLQTEKQSLNVQLEEANEKLCTLKRSSNNAINKLKNNLVTAENTVKERSTEVEFLQKSLESQTESLRYYINVDIKLTKAEEKIEEMEKLLSLKEIELEQLKQSQSEDYMNEILRLKESVEELQLRLHTVTEERDQIHREHAELLGHQNIHQKIKHVNQLKQHNLELRNKVDDLEIEISKLKKKNALLTGTKENATPLGENTPRNRKNNKPPLSPGPLRDRNQ